MSRVGYNSSVMEDQDAASTSSLLRDLPSVDELARSGTAKQWSDEFGVRHITNVCRRIVDDLRSELRDSGEGRSSAAKLLIEAEQRLTAELERERALRIHRVINATGVVVHTNLGRARLSENALKAVNEAAGFTTLEYDILTGSRGKRGAGAESLICEMTGAEDAMVVNNCAAAAFLVLTVFAAGGEVIVSRGELVEIGGDFRIPDVLARSGARLHEVGTTNRTKLADYEKAVNSETRMILKVHPSNYRVVGFSAAAGLGELAALAAGKSLIFYEDAGSGALIDLGPIGLGGEPIIADSIAAGVDLVTFSGDKLLGGPQAGIIAGKRDLIDKMRKHPLYRTLRVDKLCYAALEGTLRSYVTDRALAEIPVLRMLSMSKAELEARCAALIDKLGPARPLRAEIVSGTSAVGGGASPDFQPETALLSLTHKKLSVERLEYALRTSHPPVVSRILDGKLLLDLRTVSEDEEPELLRILASV